MFFSLRLFCSHFPAFIDISFLYNPLIYPSSIFWPSSLLLPYQNAAAAAAVAGLTASPESPNLSNHRYTLTPEKDDAAGKLMRVLCIFYFISFRFLHKTHMIFE